MNVVGDLFDCVVLAPQLKRNAVNRANAETNLFGNLHNAYSSMNWKLGFFIIWIVASICWVAFAGFAFYSDFLVPRQLALKQVACVQAHRANPALGKVSDCLYNGRLRFENRISLRSVLPKYLAIAFGPVFAVLLLGFAVAWVIAGFKRRRT